MYLKEVQLLMARAYGPGQLRSVYEREGRDYPLPYVRWTENRNMEEFLRLIGRGRIQVKPLVTHVYSLDRAPEAYDTIMQPGSAALPCCLSIRQISWMTRHPDTTQRAGSILARRPQRAGVTWALH